MAAVGPKEIKEQGTPKEFKLAAELPPKLLRDDKAAVEKVALP